MFHAATALARSQESQRHENCASSSPTTSRNQGFFLKSRRLFSQGAHRHTTSHYHTQAHARVQYDTEKCPIIYVTEEEAVNARVYAFLSCCSCSVVCARVYIRTHTHFCPPINRKTTLCEPFSIRSSATRGPLCSRTAQMIDKLWIIFP